MKQKLISWGIFFFFLVSFGYFYGDEYKDFYEKKQLQLEQKYSIEKSLQDFSSEEILWFQDIDFFYTPSQELLDTLVKKINLAEKRVYLEVYIFTEKRILEALKKAHKKWVDVQVILEKNPYLAPRLNDRRFQDLEKIWIPVYWSNSQNYTLNHSKFLIIDSELIVSTGNISYSTFTKNRDFFLFIKDTEILKQFLEIFSHDKEGYIFSPYHENLILSPWYAREKITKIFLGAKESLYLYFQYLQDTDLEEILVEKSQEGIDIKIVVDDDFYEKYEEKIDFLQEQGIEIVKYHSSVMHAKAILVDKKTLVIGSINFSSYSLDKNRETAVITSDKEVIKSFYRIFLQDFYHN